MHKPLLHNILKIVNNNEFITGIQNSKKVNELKYNSSNYSTEEVYETESYMGMALLGDIKGKIIGDYLNLPYIGAGYSRATYAVDAEYCVKIALNEEGLEGNKNEIIFYRFIKREYMELIDMFTPVIAYGDNFLVTSIGVPSSFSKLEPNDYHILSVLKMLKGKGILLEDLESRPDNFVEVAGNLRICDYAEWCTTNKKLLKDYHYSILSEKNFK